MSAINPKRYQDAQDKENRESVNVAAIVRVIAFNPEKMTVDVQPISKHLEGGVYQSQPTILGVPVSYTKSGGFVFRPWIQPDDIGLVVYVDHDIDKVVANGKESEPNTERNHSTSDAVFIGGIVTGNSSLSALPNDSAVIATEDGSTVLEISKGVIRMTTATVEINAKSNVLVKANGAITMTAPEINLIETP